MSEEKKIPEGFNEDFNSIYYVDQTTDEMITIHIKNMVAQSIMHFGKQDVELYRERCFAFCDRYVVPDDREKFDVMADLDHIDKVLRNEAVHTFIFRRLNEAGNMEYIRLKAIRCKDIEVGTGIYVGFVTVTEDEWKASHR